MTNVKVNKQERDNEDLTKSELDLPSVRSRWRHREVVFYFRETEYRVESTQNLATRGMYSSYIKNEGVIMAIESRV